MDFRWDPSEIEELPEAIRRCFWTLYETTEEMDRQVQKEKGCKSILPHLKKLVRVCLYIIQFPKKKKNSYIQILTINSQYLVQWTDFCKALHAEAKWYHTSLCPSLSEYLDNGWTSSSGPLLSFHILLGIGENIAETMAAFNSNQEIIHQASLIIRLCNDQGTSKVGVLYYLKLIHDIIRSE